MDSNSLSVVVYLFCVGFNFCYKRPQVVRPSCEIQDPNWTLLVSVCISKFLLKFGYVSNVSFAMSLFSRNDFLRH
jgi:hypothetical protein